MNASLVMEQGKFMESVAENVVEVDGIRVLHGTLEKEKCILAGTEGIYCG